MIKLVFKNLWARRKRNAWVMLELVIVTMIMWIVVDKITVNTYIKNYDIGYDIDRLYTIELSKYTEESPDYDKSQDTPEAQAENVMRILDRLRQVQGVESATISSSSQTLNGYGMAMNRIYNPDSLEGCICIIDFYPKTDFFKTYGIRSRDGITPYSEPENLGEGVIVTENAVNAVFPDRSPIGQNIRHPEYSGDELKWDAWSIVLDVVGNTAIRSNSPRSLIAFRKKNLKNINPDYIILVAKRAVGVSDKEMIRRLNEALPQLVSGNVFTRNPQPYSVMSEWVEFDMNVANILSYAVMIFFLVNICLALLSTFYMQIRARSKDAGIMRAYGFRKGTIGWMMVAEGCVITIISWIIGTALFFALGLYQYFTFDTLADSSDSNFEFFKLYNPMWYDDLLTRSCVIGSLSLLIMLIIVSVAIWIPARRIASSSPVDTIRDY